MIIDSLRYTKRQMVEEKNMLSNDETDALIIHIIFKLSCYHADK